MTDRHLTRFSNICFGIAALIVVLLVAKGVFDFVLASVEVVRAAHP